MAPYEEHVLKQPQLKSIFSTVFSKEGQERTKENEREHFYRAEKNVWIQIALNKLTPNESKVLS